MPMFSKRDLPEAGDRRGQVPAEDVQRHPVAELQPDLRPRLGGEADQRRSGIVLAATIPPR